VLNGAPTFTRAIAMLLRYLRDIDFACFGHVAVAFENFFGCDVGFLFKDWIIEK
jgi:hypothetical protein